MLYCLFCQFPLPSGQQNLLFLLNAKLISITKPASKELAAFSQVALNKGSTAWHINTHTENKNVDVPSQTQSRKNFVSSKLTKYIRTIAQPPKIYWPIKLKYGVTIKINGSQLE